MNLNFTVAENELLLTETAALRKDNEELGPGVVLVPSQKTLCHCPEEDNARLIVKLFNLGLKVPLA